MNVDEILEPLWKVFGVPKRLKWNGLLGIWDGVFVIVS